MAMKVVSANVGKLRAKRIWAEMPRPLVLEILLRAETNQPLERETWSFLAPILYDASDSLDLGHYHRHWRIDLPEGSTPNHLDGFSLGMRPAQSPSLDFITHLVIKGASALTERDLLSLADMKNLGLLRISDYPEDDGGQEGLVSVGRITDRVVRGWSEKETPFPVLRILQISRCPEVTPASMVYWAKFPVLAVVTVRAPPTVWGGRRDVHGWRCPADPDDLHVLMQRYFSSRVGLDRVPGEREDAALRDLAHAAAKTKAARFSQLLRSASGTDSSASEAVALQALLPDKLPPVRAWDGRLVPGEAKVRDEAVAAQRASPGTNFEPAELYDNPTWWIYAAIGRVLLDDEDLKAHGPAIGARYYAVNGFVLPPAPVMSVAVWPPEGGGVARAGRNRDRGIYTFHPSIRGDSVQGRGPKHVKYRFVRRVFFDDVATREPGIRAPLEGGIDLGVESNRRVKPGGGTGSVGDAVGGREREGSRARARSDVAQPVRRKKKRRMEDVLGNLGGF